MNQRKNRSAAPLAVCLAALLLLTLYTGSYLWLGPGWYPGPGASNPLRMRVFPNRACTYIYRPAGWVEAKIRGYEFGLGTDENLYNSSP